MACSIDAEAERKPPVSLSGIFGVEMRDGDLSKIPLKLRLAALLLAPLACTGGANAFQAGQVPLLSKAARNAVYQLGPGDKLRVVVFGVDELGGEFTVPGSGKVSLPLIGLQQAAGLTPEQLQVEIAKALAAGYVKDPRVNVEVLNYRPFYILGEVNKPGEYPYTDGLTVLNAVARAEGFTYRAKTRVFKRRSGEERVEHVEPLTAGAPVKPGDTIRIEERSF